jgi:serine/threonine-protein kinase RsbT
VAHRRTSLVRPGPAEKNEVEHCMDEILYSEKFTIRGNDFEHGGEVAARVKAILKQFGLDPAAIRRLSIANFEAEMNVIMYADEAELELQVLPEAVRVVLADRGQGIPDIELAMQEGYSTATPEMRQRGFGAGLGLPNIKRNSDEFEITSTPGVGTTLRYAVLTKA